MGQESSRAARSCTFRREFLIEEVRMLQILILPLNSLKMGDFQPQTSYFGKENFGRPYPLTYHDATCRWFRCRIHGDARLLYTHKRRDMIPEQNNLLQFIDWRSSSSSSSSSRKLYRWKTACISLCTERNLLMVEAYLWLETIVKRRALQSIRWSGVFCLYNSWCDVSTGNYSSKQSGMRAVEPLLKRQL